MKKERRLQEPPFDKIRHLEAAVDNSGSLLKLRCTSKSSHQMQQTYVHVVTRLRLRESLVETSDYPGLFAAADSSAIKAQKWHFRFVKLNLTLLVLVAALSSLNWSQLELLRLCAVLLQAILLVVLIALGGLILHFRYDKVWFSCRAVAESVKKETWIFVMNADPYATQGDDRKAEALFLDRLKEILQHQRLPQQYPASSVARGRPITKRIREIRQMRVKDRRDLYVSDRIRDQELWYADKAKWNARRHRNWTLVAWTLQLAATVVAIIVILFASAILNPVGVLTTSGAGVLSWLNARSYQELFQSYASVSNDLGFLEERAKGLSTKEELAAVVQDAESAISREHTVWLARRNARFGA